VKETVRNRGADTAIRSLLYWNKNIPF